jgi:L-fucose mutarotase
MLKGRSPLLSPDLLHVLSSMGHGDEPVLADASFSAASHARRIVPLIGADAPQVLDAVPGVLPLDEFFDQAAFTMQAVSDPASVPKVVRAFNATLQQHGCGKSTAIERQAVCQRAAAARANVAKPAQVSPADERRVLRLLALLSPRPGLRFVNACETMLAEQAGGRHLAQPARTVVPARDRGRTGGSGRLPRHRCGAGHGLIGQRRSHTICRPGHRRGQIRKRIDRRGHLMRHAAQHSEGLARGR